MKYTIDSVEFKTWYNEQMKAVEATAYTGLPLTPDTYSHDCSEGDFWLVWTPEGEQVVEGEDNAMALAALHGPKKA